MSSAQHQADGAALASIELHRTFIAALVLSGVLSKEEALALIESTLQRIERMQMAADQQGPAFLIEQAKAARFHIQSVVRSLSQLDVSED